MAILWHNTGAECHKEHSDENQISISLFDNEISQIIENSKNNWLIWISVRYQGDSVCEISEIWQSLVVSEEKASHRKC